MGTHILKETPRKITVADGEYIYINGILKQCRYWKSIDPDTKIETEKHDFYIISGDVVVDPGAYPGCILPPVNDSEERMVEFNELMDQLEKDDPDYEP